jgi:hypothetical protein
MWTNYGFKIMDDRLSHWNKLLRKWCKCLEEFCSCSNTVPSLNKEETHVGILAGAAWKIGWVGFQEMLRNRNNRINYKDVCDLYLCDFYGIVEDYIECKKIRVNGYNNILGKLNEACVDAKSLVLDDTSEKARRIGVVFADFEFQRLSDEDIEHNIAITFDNIATIQCDVMAWSFPKVARFYRDKNLDTGSEIILPGTVLLAKFVGYKTIIEQ